MACKIIYNGQKYTDEEFKKYLEDNHLTEPDLIHEKAMIDTASTYAPTFKGIYKDIFAANPRGAMIEIAQQANSSAGEKRGMIKAVGREVVRIAQDLFPDAKVKNPKPTVELSKAYQTAYVGNHEGEQEFILQNGKVDKSPQFQTPMKMEQIDAIRKWDAKFDDKTTKPKGETMGQFVGRVLGQYLSDKANRIDNTVIVTHSSVLKTIKSYEYLKDTPAFKDANWYELDTKQRELFAERYIKESTKNGDIERFKSSDGHIIITRHGQTEDNLSGKFRTSNTNLTEQGKREAFEVGQKIQKMTGGLVPEIVSSDLPRTIDTSELIARGISEPNDLYLQAGGSIPSPASKKVLDKIKEFNDRIGVKQENLEAIVVNGKRLNANGLAIPYKGLIQIVNGKVDVALPEESMHIAVEIIQQKSPALFKRLMNNVNKHPEMQEVLDDYSGNKLYQLPDGKPDVIKLKKEAAAKVLVKTIKNIEDNTTTALVTMETVKMWNDIKDWFKKLFGEAGFDPFEEAAHQVLGNTEFHGTVQDIKDDKKAFLDKNKDAVNYQLSGLKKLADNIQKITKWEQQIKNPDILFKKIQSDLQIPKDQLALVQGSYNGNIIDAMTSVAADMVYTVEVKRGVDSNHFREAFDPEDGGMLSNEEMEAIYKRKAYDAVWDRGELEPGSEAFDEAVKEEIKSLKAIENPSTHYNRLTVSGGTNYEEHDIRVPGVIPAIHSHAEFANDNSIGWFRSDTSLEKNMVVNKETGELQHLGNGPSDTRRILEVQSDLFQKGRDKSDLTGDSSYFEPGVGQMQNLQENKPDLKANQFLQLLNKDGNWINFFVKSIMQDSEKKGYKTVRFPAGDTASKVEGHQTLTNHLQEINDKLETFNKVLKDPEAYFSDITRAYENPIHPELSHFDKEAFIEITKTQIKRLEDAKAELKSQGIEKLKPIYAFYEIRLKNTLDKTYGKENVGRVTDEHGNDWFELAVNSDRDHEIFLQLDEATTFKKIDDTSRTISKDGSEYKVNGIPIKNSVDKIVERAIEKKFPTHNEFQQELAQFRKEYRGRIEQEISTIAKKYIGDDGLLRKEVSDDPLPSIIDPYNRQFITKLDDWFADKVDSYPAGTKFLTNKDLYNPKADFAGRANFIAIVPTAEGNKVDINQFKLITPRKGSTGVDYRIKPIYDLEIQGLRDILSKAYAIPASEFRETRAIPIKAGYYPDERGDIKLQSLKIGNVDVNLEKDPFLLPIPSFSELTGNAALDELITRFRATADLEAKTPAAKGQEKAKANRVAEAFAALTQLQIRKNAAGILKSGNMAVSLQESKFPVLKKKIEDTNPVVAQVKGIGDLFNELDQAKRKLSPYVDLGRLMSEIYGESADETKAAEALSDKANKETAKIEKTMVYLRTQKLSKVTNIKDELKAEKNIDSMRKYSLGPSHASFKSGGQIHHLIEHNTNLLYLKSLKRFEELDDLAKAINSSGVKWEDVEKKILEYDDKGRWTGKTIQQLDKSFYDTINAAVKSKNLAKVRESIDLDAYKTAYDEGLEDIKEYYSHDGNIGDNPPEGSIEKARAMRIENWKITHDINKKTSINPANSLLFRFPKEGMWDSEKYKDLLQAGNKPVLDLFNWYRDLVNKADELGMFHEMGSTKYGFFANIEKGLIEKLSKGGFNKGIIDPFRGMTTTPGGEKYGEFDPVSYKPINTVRGVYLRDLGVEAHDTDGNYFKDYSNVSHDLPRTFMLFAEDVANFELKTETEGTAKLIYATEAMIPSLKGTRTKTGQRELQKIPNVTNLDTIAQYMEYYWYNKPMADQADATMEVNLGWVKKLNDRLGFKLIPEPKTDVVTFSALGILSAVKNFYWMKTMVFNAVGALAWAGGGSMGAILNQGEFFDTKDFMRAYGQMIGVKGGEAGKLRQALVDYFQPTLFSSAGERAKKLSSDSMVKALNPSKLYILMSEADKLIANNVAIAYINNTIIRDGKLLNIRKLVKEQNNWDNRFSLEPADRQALERKVDAEIDEMQKNSPELLMKVAKVDSKGRLGLNLANEEEEYVKYRAQLRRLLAEALGNMGSDDIPLYHRFTLPSVMMTFKSWIPELIYKRYGPMEYNYGAHDYTYGRGRAVVSLISNHGLGVVGDITKLLTGNKETIIDWAKQQWEKDRQKAADKGEPFDIPLGKYVDLKTEGVVSGLKEIGLVLALLGMYFGAVAAAKNFKNEDHATKGWISFTLRTIDRLQDEVSFFYNPKAFAALASGAIFPPLSLLLDMGTLFKNSAAWGIDKATGNDAAAAKIHNMKILYRDLPILKEWAKYETILSAQFAKENGYTLPLGEASTQQ